MLKIFYRIFFLYFSCRFINILCMRNGILTSLIVVCFSLHANASSLVISDSASMPTSGTYDDLHINGTGTYSLATLDLITNGSSSVLIDTRRGAGHVDGIVSLVIDSGFDGTFDATLDKQSFTKISLRNDYLSGISGQDIVWFDDLHLTGSFVYEYDTENGNYRYDIGYCNDGSGRRCIKRFTSNEYLNMQRTAFYNNQVATRGVQNNPKMLLQPMIVINQHELIGAYEFSDDVFMSVAPEYYNSKNFQNAGLRLNSGTSVGGRVRVGVGMYAARAQFQNDVSDFKSNIYGGNIRLKYDLDEIFFLRGVGGVSFASIDCDDVKSGAGVVSNPNAIGLYGGADFGAKFNFESGLYLSPFVGVATLSQSVVDIHVRDSFGHFGNDVGFKYFMDGVTYSYILRTGINSHGYLDASIGIGAWTIADKIGGSVSVGFVDTDFGWSGKFSANVKFSF